MQDGLVGGIHPLQREDRTESEPLERRQLEAVSLAGKVGERVRTGIAIVGSVRQLAYATRVQHDYKPPPQALTVRVDHAAGQITSERSSGEHASQPTFGKWATGRIRRSLANSARDDSASAAAGGGRDTRPRWP